MSSVQITKNGENIIYNFEIEKFKFSKIKISNKYFNKLNISGVKNYEAIEYTPGSPQIPVIRLMVPTKPEISFGEEEFLSKARNDLKLMPAQASRIKLPHQHEQFALNNKAYESVSFSPKQRYKIEEAGSIRGQKQYLVTLYPVAYAPKTNNYKFISKFSVSYKKDKENLLLEPQNFVFIIADNFKNNIAIKKYADFKISRGFNIINLIVKPEDEPVDIRFKLKDLYKNNNIKYALIFGDAELVQAKQSDIISGITDHYYKSLDIDNYEEDINTPDIHLGRISVSTESDLESVINKYIKYEQGIFNNEKWLNSPAFLATDDRHEIAENSHNYVIENYTIKHGYTGIFPHENEAGGDKLYAITHNANAHDVQKSLTQGRLIINYSGHGSTTGWDAPYMDQNDVRALNHSDATAFVISNACITGQFSVDESFAETWQRHPQGAIMFLGSMDSTYWDEDDIFERALYDGIFRENLTTFGDIISYALKQVWLFYGGTGRSAYYWETYINFGDPSHELRTTYTKKPTINGNFFIPLGTNEISFSITDDNNNALKNSKIILSNHNNLLFFGITDQDGKATINFNNRIQEPHKFNLLVTGQNLRANVADFNVFPAQTPFLSFSHFLVNEREEAQVYLSEHIKLNFNVTNWGEKETLGAKVRIQNITGPADIISFETLVPALAQHETYLLNDSNLALKIHDEAHDHDPITLELLWETKEGQHGIANTTLYLSKAALSMSAESNNLRPGDKGEIYLTITNTGSEPIINGHLHLLPQSCLDAIEGEAVIDRLDPNQSLRLEKPFKAYVSKDCHNGDKAPIEAVLNYSSLARRNKISATNEITIGIINNETISHENIDLLIPDDAEAAVFSFEWNKPGIISDLGLALSITHSYISDLQVILVHPSGQQIILHNREDADSENLERSYGFNGTASSDLNNLFGLRAEGEWKIIIYDHAPRDIGMLNNMSLYIAGYFE
jgi:subtilisin-like proprotein convertase family protein